MPAELTYHAPGATPFDRYVIEWLAETLGLAARELGADDVTAGETPALAWSGGDSDARVVVPRHPGEVVWRELVDGRVDPSTLPSRLPFDVLSAIGALLADRVNEDVPRKALDPHGRVPFGATLQAREGLGELALVNTYVDLLRKLLRREAGLEGLSAWPDGKVAAIGLTHDVDRPYKWARLRAFREARVPRLRAAPMYVAKVAWAALERARTGATDDFWLFHPLMDAETERGFRSTFFFASMPLYGRWGDARDVDYDIGWRRFDAAFREIGERGFEVGLHASYEAYRSVERFEWEKRRLEERSRAAVTGLRHHYWHLGPDEDATLAKHEAAGFEYDCSVGFNDDPGFRRSVALPFRPWSERLARPLRLLELPTFLMDGSIFYRGSTPEAALQRIRGFVETIKASGGLGVVDWHVRASLPANREYGPWGEAYVRLLDLLAADPSIWATSTGEISRWVAERRARLAARD